MSYTIKDNTKEVLAAMEKALETGLEAVGLTAEGYAKRATPVDTGNLRNSITHTHDGKDAYIGTNVEYAPYVELGTSKMSARPYLKPAATEHGEEYRRLLEAAMKSE